MGICKEIPMPFSSCFLSPPAFRCCNGEHSRFRDDELRSVAASCYCLSCSCDEKRWEKYHEEENTREREENERENGGARFHLDTMALSFFFFSSRSRFASMQEENKEGNDDDNAWRLRFPQAHIESKRERERVRAKKKGKK